MLAFEYGRSCNESRGCESGFGTGGATRKAVWYYTFFAFGVLIKDDGRTIVQ
jgi:hypothetical protein